MKDRGHNARSGLGTPLGLAMEASGRAVGSLFKAASALRGGKSLHPSGVVHEATLTVSGLDTAPPARVLRAAGEHRALVRFSRSFGFPKPLPDLLGMSLRLPDVYGPSLHQDFLLVTSVDMPLAHHVFLPATGLKQRPYSSSLPYRAGDRLFLVGALPRPGVLSFDLAVAPLMGRFQPVGRIDVGPRLPQDLDALPFNPWNTGGGLAPAGDFFNRLRDYAYPMSQEGWQPRVSARPQDHEQASGRRNGRPLTETPTI